MNSQTEREKLLIENAYMSSLHNKLWLTEWNAKNHINLSMTEVSVLEILKEEGPKLAKELGISRAGLIMKVEKYGLDKRAQKRAAGE